MRPADLPDGVGFRCEQCGSLFPDLGSLQQHLLAVHTGRRSALACELCGARFGGPAELELHLRSAHAPSR